MRSGGPRSWCSAPWRKSSGSETEFRRLPVDRRQRPQPLHPLVVLAELADQRAEGVVDVE